jgi:hypothetical protein
MFCILWVNMRHKKPEADESERDIVFETVEEALAVKKKHISR